jgi:hypothetical protein
LVRCYFQSSSMLMSERCQMPCSLSHEHIHPRKV